MFLRRSCSFISSNLKFRKQFLNTSLRTYKFVIDKSKVPNLCENDLEEKLVKGSGPGGQKVNTSSNACFLKHIPTGLVVKCHEFRLAEQNRKHARELLKTQLDNLYNGENSVEKQKERYLKEKTIKENQKRRKRLEMKKQFKSQHLEESTE